MRNLEVAAEAGKLLALLGCQKQVTMTVLSQQQHIALLTYQGLGVKVSCLFITIGSDQRRSVYKNGK